MKTCSLPLVIFGVLLASVGLRAAETESGAVPDASPARPATVPATAHDIAQAIARLGDNDPLVRDAATRTLAGMGKAALPALREAANGDDPEVASRARHLLADFRFGIDPDTAAALLELINQYRGDQEQARTRAIEAMSRWGWPGYRVLARLHRQETDPDWHLRLSAPLLAGAPAVLSEVRTMIAAGKEDDAEARLADAAVGGNESVMRSYAALLLARGRIDQAIPEIRGYAGAKPGTEDTLLLALLYRAKGDADAALRHARQLGPTAELGQEGEDILREILLDRRDWAGLVAETWRPAFRPDKLSYARLGGDAKSFDEAAKDLREMAEQEPRLLPNVAVALMLNDRPAEGIDMLVKAGRYSAAYRLMTSQGRYADAAKLLADVRTDAPPELPVLELTAARSMITLGDKDGATAIVDRIEKDIASNAADPATGELIETELALGRADTACQLAVAAMAASAPQLNTDVKASGNPILGRIAPGGGINAIAWRGFLADRDPKATPAEILHKLWALYARKLPAAEAESILRDAADNAAGQKPADRAAIYGRIVETARSIGRGDLADSTLEKLADDREAGAFSGWFPSKALGDRASAKKDYRRAAECYEKALRRSSADPIGEPICHWLHGWSTMRAAAGDADQAAGAKTEMRRADECLLADDESWYRFIQAIGDAGAEATGDAEAQRELMRRVCLPGSWWVNESYRLSARAMLPIPESPDEMSVPDTASDQGADAPQRVGPRYLRAADLVSRWMLPIAHGRSTFVQIEAYLSQPAIIHTLRARGLIATGDVAAALKEADMSLSTLPVNTQLPIDLVPALDRQGHKSEADVLFNKVAAAMDAGIARYPRSAQLHNNRAWMSAKCGRDLDQALAHARQATTLAPDTVAYLDTLAEAQFRRGDRQAAIDTMKHCIELDPHFGYLQHQLKRFTGDAPATQP